MQVLSLECVLHVGVQESRLEPGSFYKNLHFQGGVVIGDLEKVHPNPEVHIRGLRLLEFAGEL